MLKSVSKNALDFESVNEIREKMIQSRYLGSIEAPAIIDESFHYIPNIYLLHKKILNVTYLIQ